MKKILLPLAAFCLAGMSYLLMAPLPVDPEVWTPQAVVETTGIYAPNGVLKNVQRVAEGVGEGPDGIAVDALGRVYAGYEDGRIAIISANGASYQDLGSSRHGRPLGITFGPNGGLVIADAAKGLVALGAEPKTRPLVKTVDERALLLAADADNTRLDKNVYFTDASRFPLRERFYDTIEHRGSGRLLEYNVVSKQTRVLMEGLAFANGVAVGPDDAYLLVSESGACRIRRYWLKGEKVGTHEVFIEHLPGTPEKLSYDERHRMFWLALDSARADDLAAMPVWEKKLLARLPAFLWPGTGKKAWVLGITTDGKVAYSLDDESSSAYGPITSVEAWGPWLWFGSRSETSLGRLPISLVIAGTAAPPAGWQKTPRRPKQLVYAPTEEERRERQEEEMERTAAGASDEDDDEEEEEEARERESAGTRR